MWMLLFGLFSFADAEPSPMSFEVELTIGSEDEDDHLLFSSSTFFAIGAEGKIAILDGGNKRGLLFSKKGEFIGEIGRAGEGPGEYSSPSGITSDPQGNFYIFDAQASKVCKFDGQGQYINTVRLPSGVVGLVQPNILHNGNITLSYVKLDENQQQVYFMSVFSPKMELIEVLARQPQPTLDWSQTGSSDFWAEFLKGHLEGLGKGIPLSAATPSGMVSLISNQYSGEMRDLQGKQRGVFSRKSSPVLMSEEMKQNMGEMIYQKVTASGDIARFLPYSVYQKAMRTAEFPQIINPVSQLFSTSSGFGVLVSYDTVKQKGRIELFDDNGAYVQGGMFRGTADSMKWRDGYLYTMGESEDGVQMLQRYKVKGLSGLN